jgi:post-segregation antitoxin (ccd killing protein)
MTLLFRRILRRMPRMQVYLPDALYQQVKERRLPASELLQEAVRAELRRQELEEQADAYLADLVAEVGEPSAAEVARAEAIARRIRDHHSQQAS